MYRLLVLAALLSFLVPATRSPGQTTLPTVSATLGFGGVFRTDSWAPIYVRLADTQSRPATLEVRTARGRLGHSVAARIVTTSVPTTYTLYAPLGALDRASLQLRDERGKLIHGIDLSDLVQQTPTAMGGPAFAIASADVAVAQRIATQLVRDSGEYIGAGVVRAQLLPERALGYAGLDVLVLPELDTDTLDDVVEAAIVAWTRSGGIAIAWPAAQAPTLNSPLRDLLPMPGDAGVRQLSDQQGQILWRRHGLGEIVWCATDPSRGLDTPADRLALWRRVTSDQVSLRPDDRRAGVFDPLVAQAVAEQSLRIPPTATLWFTRVLLGCMALGLIAGPVEALLLLAVRRQPQVWYTRGGLVLLVVSGALFAVRPAPAAVDAPAIELWIEGDGQAIERATLAGRTRADRPTQWLTGDRLDASRRPAAELRLGQRSDRFEVLDGEVLSLGGEPAKVRGSETMNNAPAMLVVDAASPLRSGNASDRSWDAIAIAGANELRVQQASVPAGANVECSAAPTPSDVPNTRRIETGIERLASLPGWEGLLLDRRLAERLVRLQETEGARIVIGRSIDGAVRRFVVHVERGQ